MTTARPRARTFVALALGAELGARVAAEVAAVLARDFRLTHGPGLHLTLAFLGDVERERIGVLAEAFARHAGALAPPQLRLTGTGAFPTLARARVLWVGVEERTGAGRLEACRAAVLAALAQAGFEGVGEEHEGFTPHVTVARPRGARARVPPAFGALRLGLAWDPAALELFESHMGPGGSRYESLARLPFVEPG